MFIPARWIYTLLNFFLVATAALPACAGGTENPPCHPAVDFGRTQYIVGYGSLMDTASKNRTWHNAERARPVRVIGFERGWYARGRDFGFSTTYLGVTRKAGARMAAALFRVDKEADFNAGDAREYVYCRVPVPPERITLLDGSEPPKDAQIWLYLLNPQSTRPADARFPVIQSYVDLFLTGCIELARQVTQKNVDFPAECVTTTKGWPMYWVNDRIYPRRPYHQPNAARIDALLNRLLPEQFKAIRLE
jgi:hypothetical protein